MKIKDAIKKLSLYDSNEEIIIAWWDEEMSPIDIKEISWEEQVGIAEEEMDWCVSHEQLSETILNNCDDLFEDKDTEQKRDE